ncbi:MAG: amidohydrolase family protein, partial [Actinomycetota bacterium]
VSGDRIERVLHDGEELPHAARTIEARGRVLAPGFIDTHSHSDVQPFVEPSMDSALRQGITTVIAGNCGGSGAPGNGRREGAELSGISIDDLPEWRTFSEYLELAEEARPAINVASLVGHGTIRGNVLGSERRPPDGDELAEMRRQLEEALAAGAVGLSTGLVYAPGMYATTQEIVDVARPLADANAIYASHIRAEGELLWDAVDEAIEIGRRAGVRAHISHLKLETQFVWGRSDDLLGRLRAARDGGDDVSADQYPYTAYETNLSSFLPPWAPAAELGGLLGDASSRERLRRSVLEGERGWQSSVRGVGWDRVTAVGNRARGPIGRSVADLAAQESLDPFDVAMELIAEDPETIVIGHAMQEPDVEAILADPEVMVGTDGLAVSPSGALGAFGVHPRYYGTFPRILGRYVRERRVLDLPTAVRKMTSIAAERFRLDARGRIREGAFADLVLFDDERISDEATFAEPHRFPSGVDVVVVNGTLAWADGRLGDRSGRILRRS